jgi:hypothetical protein
LGVVGRRSHLILVVEVVVLVLLAGPVPRRARVGLVKIGHARAPRSTGTLHRVPEQK